MHKLILVSLLIATAANAEKIFTTPSVVEPAPKIELANLTFQSEDLAKYQGKVVLLHFWATWCSSCLQELPELQSLWEKLQAKGLVVIAVAADSRKNVNEFLPTKNFTFPIWIDQYGKAMRDYKVQVFPMTFLIGRNGKLLGTAIGSKDWNKENNFTIMENILKYDSKIFKK